MGERMMQGSLLKVLLWFLLLIAVPQLSRAEGNVPLVTANANSLNFENCLFKRPNCRSDWLNSSQKQSLQAEQARQNFYYCSNHLPQCQQANRPPIVQKNQINTAQRLANQRRYQIQQARALAAKRYMPPVHKPAPRLIQHSVATRPLIRPQFTPQFTPPRPPANYSRPDPQVQQNKQLSSKFESTKQSKPDQYQSGEVSPHVEYVRGYTRKNGTQVKGYYRTKRDKKISNNFSYYKNVNPYTGKRGSVYPPNFSSSRVTYVRGYYRKDRTYVRGHYRRR
jgi:hypothetical protein